MMDSHTLTPIIPGDKARVFRGDQLQQISMPLGGIGAGCVGLNGYGGLQDFSIRNHPSRSALPDDHSYKEAAFALLHLKGPRPLTKLLEGPLPPNKIYDQGLKAQGYRGGGHEGLPRFQECVFKGAYPFGWVELSDPDVPLQVTLLGYSPFIPLDDKNSGLPAAILEYTLENITEQTVEFEFSYHLSHLAEGKEGFKSTRNRVLPGFGVYFFNTDHPAAETFGSAALGLLLADIAPIIKGMWLRGPWFDALTALWREVDNGTFRANDGNILSDLEGRNGGSLLVPGRLQPGEKLTIPLVIAWYFPNCYLTVGKVTSCSCGDDCQGEQLETPAWRPYYASQWGDAAAVAQYVREQYLSLRGRTLAFWEALYSSTLPAEVLDAVGSNLAILKSPTVLRQENGSLWGWEGCFPTQGCCPGSCTHVWNYAQALPHLFPHLERTLREGELVRSMNEEGHVNFRAALPDGPTTHSFHAAADGQLGGILKLYRDWQISGEDDWLRQLYPLAKRSLDFCIRQWDPERRGILTEPHHNTYDIEFWGPEGMCGSIYLGALSAMALMARELGDLDAAQEYAELAQRGAAFLDQELFNGEYYEQKILWQETRDHSFRDLLAAGEGIDAERLRIFKAEGPPYQYGRGCLADGVIGAWMAKLYGVDIPLKPEHIRRHLQAVFHYNFRPDLSNHACTQRPGYALGKEAGLLLCSWPRGDKPTLPFVYSDEVWTGIEYQVASHLIMEGMVEEGLTLVRATRSRYEGRTRNPFDEYECGSYYARAMASYALLLALAGFRYSRREKTLWLSPRLALRPFKTFFSTATGFGTLVLTEVDLRIEMVEGELELEVIYYETPAGKKVLSGGMARAGENFRVEF